MGRKSVISQYNMFEGGASMAADNTSETVNVKSVDSAVIHVTWTAGPVGVFYLQARNGSIEARDKQDDSWFDVDLGSAMTISGADSELQIQLSQMPGTEIRLFYDRTSGTAADLKALLSAKVQGA